MGFDSRWSGEAEWGQEAAGAVSVDACISCPNPTESPRACEGGPSIVPISRKRELRPEEVKASVQDPRNSGSTAQT